MNISPIYEKFINDYFKKDHHEEYVNAHKKDKELFLKICLQRTDLRSLFNCISHNSDFIDLLLKDLIHKEGATFFQTEKCTDLFNDILINDYFEEKEEEKAVSLIEYALEHGMSLNFEEAGIPLVHYSTAFGLLKVTHYLVEKGVDVNLIDKYDDSVLDSAIHNDEYTELFHYLFNLPHLNKKLSHKYLSTALDESYQDILNMIQSSEVIKDNQFLKKALKDCEEKHSEVLMWIEKNTIEESLVKDSTINQNKKIKI